MIKKFLPLFLLTSSILATSSLATTLTLNLPCTLTLTAQGKKVFYIQYSTDSRVQGKNRTTTTIVYGAQSEVVKSYKFSCPLEKLIINPINRASYTTFITNQSSSDKNIIVQNKYFEFNNSTNQIIIESLECLNSPPIIPVPRLK